MRARLFAICVLSFLTAACNGSSSSISVTSPTTAKCEVAVENAPSATAPAAGMSSTLTISTNRDCTWTASTAASWIAITSATSGQGSGSLAYRVSTNADPAPRQASLDVNNTHVAVTQDAAPCRYAVSPSNTTVSANGGNLAITMETLTGCAWSASSSVAWLSLPANP